MDFAKNVRRILICRFDDKRCCGDIYGRIASMTSKRGIILRLHFVPLYLNVPCCLIKQPRSKTRSRGYSQHSTAQQLKMGYCFVSLFNSTSGNPATYSFLAVSIRLFSTTNQNLIPALLRAFSRMPTTVTDSVNSSCAVT